eukprot:GHUV01048010.1.p2 GENE.GHUV01048010.1~~GHUV01048010.1.p2  ORF type:complete len:126 (-),score=23.44 GHUV01048010.1:251-628(-)
MRHLTSHRSLSSADSAAVHHFLVSSKILEHQESCINQQDARCCLRLNSKAQPALPTSDKVRSLVIFSYSADHASNVTWLQWLINRRLLSDVLISLLPESKESHGWHEKCSLTCCYVTDGYFHVNA